MVAQGGRGGGGGGGGGGNSPPSPPCSAAPGMGQDCSPELQGMHSYKITLVRLSMLKYENVKLSSIVAAQ